MSDAGWFGDPTGRFGQRWYDGRDWTASVVGANGQVLEDPLPKRDVPAQPAYQAGGYAPASWPATTSTRYAPGLGLAVGAVGVLLVALSLFALKWADNSDGTFVDLGKAVRKIGSDDYPYLTAYLYAAWLGFVLFAATVIFVLAAGLPLPRSRTGNIVPRVVGAVLAGAAAVLQTAAIVDVFKGPGDPQFGAWLGVAGYLVVVVGMAIGARRIAR